MIEPSDRSTREAVFTFIWSFKKGDNIDYNFLVLDQLYGARRACGTQDGKSLFNKPIIVTIVAIVECILADFIDRIKQHRHEPIANLSPARIHNIRYKAKGGRLVERQINELTHFIDQVAKHDLFDAKSVTFMPNSTISGRFAIASISRTQRIVTCRPMNRRCLLMTS